MAPANQCHRTVTVYACSGTASNLGLATSPAYVQPSGVAAPTIGAGTGAVGTGIAGNSTGVAASTGMVYVSPSPPAPSSGGAASGGTGSVGAGSGGASSSPIAYASGAATVDGVSTFGLIVAGGLALVGLLRSHH